MIKKTAQAALVVGTVLLSAGLAHADDAVDEAALRDRVNILTANVEEQNLYSSGLPAVTDTLGMPRPGDNIPLPIEVDFTANEDSKTAQLDVTADQA
ncbi:MULTISPECIES: hypothetical protein [unclassified Streptomyces]|uniref:hypothetical protein n=1 Tax=unclassified Streptomyces TaxID=2593676 RepID=UPI002DD7FCF5|nr:hypothetical protein [Streptomyces sp. NBC_01237]WRZ76427.1 hypothetical protein OG251_35075 [Streptomyces sp. NBC_01237]